MCAAENLRTTLTWSYELQAAGADIMLNRITGLIELGARAVSHDEEPQYIFESGSKRIDEAQLSELPDLRLALLNFDRHIQWTPRSVNRWISLSHDALASHKNADAFTALLHALDRAGVPYLKLRAKDDSGLKRRAADATFEGGKQVQAIEMLETIVRNKLALVQAALK